MDTPRYVYDAMTEALAALKDRGFTHDFNLKEHCVSCQALDLDLHPEQFRIVETHRFEGFTSPEDSSVVYAIESDDGVKGVLVDAYGAYSVAVTPELARKLSR